MIEVSNIRLPLDAGLVDGEGIARSAAANVLGVKVAQIAQMRLLKRSVDARKKNDVGFVATYGVELDDAAVEEDILAGRRSVSKRVNVKRHEPYQPLEIPRQGLADGAPRPVVVGTGPAGLFAGLYLARAGLQPIVIERGGDVDERTRAIEEFDGGANLDLATNVQFGEGGAGTFSDGKLTTGTKSPLAKHVLHWFVDAGAPDEILWQAKPHIGTDNLVKVVRRMRQQITQAGGDVVFHAKLDDVEFGQDGMLRAIAVRCADERAATRLAGIAAGGFGQSGEDGPSAGNHATATGQTGQGAPSTSGSVARIACNALVLACGHSARDTFRMLQRANLAMEPKAFSVGVRIEHLQKDVDRAQYGAAADHPALGAADYKLVEHLPNGRSVYTFCMCPGGKVMAAASEEYGVVVNGMSAFARDGENANAALLVGVTPDDFRSSDPLAGTVFQRRIEQAAFGEAHELGGKAWQAPAQTVGDFMADTAGNPSPTVIPSYARGVVWCDLREILPEFVCDSIAEALPRLDRKLHGFANPGAVMTGVETRSSSPVRILRDDDTLQAWRRKPGKRVRPRDIARGHGRIEAQDERRNPTGIFPAGEGPGYAGGIMSAAVDGLRTAQAVAAKIGVSVGGDSVAAASAAAVESGFGALAFDHRLSADTAVGSTSDAPASAGRFLAVDEAAAALRHGEAVAFPTDTVYGIGVAVDYAASPQAVYDIKKRDAGKPIAWLVGGPQALDRYGADVPERARQLAEAHWPGALTVIVKASDAVPAAFRSDAGTIGLRMPASDTALALIHAVGCPLATSSANVSGCADARTADGLAPELLREVAGVVESAEPASGVASTVIDCSQGEIAVIRQGDVKL